jgi:hypothetical protein
MATYLGTLSLFGVAHVFIELRYLDAQYFSTVKQQCDTSFVFWLVNLLLVIAALRCVVLLGWLPNSIGFGLELGCGLGLVLLATRALWQQLKAGCSPERRVRLGVALAIATLLVLGIMQSPITTLVLLAILHNLTPIGFLYHHPTSSVSLGWAASSFLDCCRYSSFMGVGWERVGMHYRAWPPMWQPLSRLRSNTVSLPLHSLLPPPSVNACITLSSSACSPHGPHRSQKV